MDFSNELRSKAENGGFLTESEQQALQKNYDKENKIPDEEENETLKDSGESHPLL